MAHNTEVKAVLRAYKKALDTLQRLDRDRRNFRSALLDRARGGRQQVRACPCARCLASARGRGARPCPSRARRRRRGRDRLGRARLVRRSRPKLDPLDAQHARLVGLVSIPRLDDRLCLFAGGEGFDGFLG